MKCEGRTRRVGALSFGPPVWVRCENTPIALLTVKQGKEKKTELPACGSCWQKCIQDENIKILSARPIIVLDFEEKGGDNHAYSSKEQSEAKEQ